VLGWTVTVNDEIIPMWPSVVAFLLFAALSARCGGKRFGSRRNPVHAGR
jgi:hypothetical protein